MKDLKRQRLAKSILQSEDRLREILEEKGLEFDLSDLVCQATLASELSKIIGVEGGAQNNPDLFQIFGSLSKTTNMLEYMTLSDQQYGKITEDTLLKTMLDHEAVKLGLEILPMSERQARKNCLQLIREAVPVIVDFKGAVIRPKGEYQLTEVGKKAAHIWMKD